MSRVGRKDAFDRGWWNGRVEKPGGSWFACRGYVSQSEMWSAVSNAIEQRVQCLGSDSFGPYQGVILYLGVHDPSGLDMTGMSRNAWTCPADRWTLQGPADRADLGPRSNSTSHHQTRRS